MENIRRGDIFYIHKYPVIGSEQEAGRPGIIVSNEANNRHSGTVEVVFLTTQAKAELPTHVHIESAARPSTALCEQVTTVSIERLGDYGGRLTEREMTQVDIALLISLDLTMGETGNIAGGGHYAPAPAEERPDDGNPASEDGSVAIVLKAERDTYKAMYESLLEKVLGGIGA